MPMQRLIISNQRDAANGVAVLENLHWHQCHEMQYFQTDNKGAEMQLYLLRHAVALEREEFKGDSDSERPLTADGRKKMRRAARGMRKLGISFDLILSSPLVRARDTADIVAHEFTTRRHLKLTDHLKPGADQKALVQALRKIEHARDVVLVGHEPDLSILLSRLLGVKSPEALKMKKGALCLLSVDKLRYGACARLEWMMTAKQMGQFAG